MVALARSLSELWIANFGIVENEILACMRLNGSDAEVSTPNGRLRRIIFSSRSAKMTKWTDPGQPQGQLAVPTNVAVDEALRSKCIGVVPTWRKFQCALWL